MSDCVHHRVVSARDGGKARGSETPEDSWFTRGFEWDFELYFWTARIIGGGKGVKGEGLI